MNGAWFVPDATTVVIFGGGCALLGLAGLLERPGDRRVRTWTNGLALLVVLGAAVAFAAGLPWSAAAAALAVGAVPLVLASARLTRPYLLGALSAVLSRPRLHGAALLAAGPLSLLGWIGYVEYFYFGPEGSLSHLPPTAPTPPLRSALFHARTDRATPLPLWSFRPNSEFVTLIREEEDKISRALAAKVIRTAPPSFDTNCHGWVFCDGRFCVQDSDVERILRDNDYRPVDDPRPGDLIVYRLPRGEINHTGVVRLVGDGRVLVESKWGALGRYLHAPADQPYGDGWTFYRAPRPGHLLTIESGEAAE